MKKLLFAFLIFFSLIFFSPEVVQTASAFECGESFTVPMFSVDDCNCANYDLMNVYDNPTTYHYCCGWFYDGYCNSTAATIDPSPTPRVEIPEVDAGLLNSFNPLTNFSSKASRLSTPRGIISEVLQFIFPISGIILFFMLIMAGLKMLTGATNSSNMEDAKKIISTAILGFIILFASYWIAQLLEIIFCINILGN
jgi:hypothetical protein